MLCLSMILELNGSNGTYSTHSSLFVAQHGLAHLLYMYAYVSLPYGGSDKENSLVWYLQFDTPMNLWHKKNQCQLGNPRISYWIPTTIEALQLLFIITSLINIYKTK